MLKWYYRFLKLNDLILSFLKIPFYFGRSKVIIIYPSSTATERTLLNLIIRIRQNYDLPILVKFSPLAIYKLSGYFDYFKKNKVFFA